MTFNAYLGKASHKRTNSVREKCAPHSCWRFVYHLLALITTLDQLRSIWLFTNVNATYSIDFFEQRRGYNSTLTIAGGPRVYLNQFGNFRRQSLNDELF